MALTMTETVRVPRPVHIHRLRSALSVLVALATSGLIAFSILRIVAYAYRQGNGLEIAVVAALFALLSAYVVLLGARAVALSARAGRAVEIHHARELGAQASLRSWNALAWSCALLIATGLAWLLVLNDAAVSRTFFDLALIRNSSGEILSAFTTNIVIFAVSVVLILVWALVIAIARTLPGDAGRPLRLMATAYCDLFRGLPSVITIYLIGFGLPLTNLPLVSALSSSTYAIIALTLTYGAYTSEIYRAGIEGVHHSLIAAARSLGFSHAMTLRHVVIPIALRNIVPPLMNDCISLQKDTALVSVIGTIDAFNQSKIIAANNFNLSAVTTVAILFVAITIPQARLVDRLTQRAQRRRRAGGA
ncbi:amino acid ABC transporter permease [Gluconacetobacter sp. 1b LMG 1731]|uniref:Amino acid ABC transporter permease n=1 Tax=Gluconacetobacter dulcium TaxID=2729096 RepID=A0A7W4IKN5_9PROT|nr:amino acid ABC transporter permease [Gluconacetobacter dulcium]MBB2164601.1 amino acid ABC transporter permease [Gluconacetobacter dulcium]MBB2193632.1 amino acid ABC transporter permease [Gluconacetobacter dulcium]